MRTKETQHLPKYYTNKKIREAFDHYLHIMNASNSQFGGAGTTDEDQKKIDALANYCKAKMIEVDLESFQHFYPTYDKTKISEVQRQGKRTPEDVYEVFKTSILRRFKFPRRK